MLAALAPIARMVVMVHPPLDILAVTGQQGAEHLAAVNGHTANFDAIASSIYI